jgi:hypothetical protein
MGFTEILALKDAVLGFAGDLNDRIQKVPHPKPDVIGEPIEI